MNSVDTLKKNLFLLLLNFVLLISQQTIHANSADLDNNFDFDGKVTTNFVGKEDFCRGVAIQIDGKIVCAGRMMNNSNINDFAVARYNVGGSLDSNFGVGGKVTTDFNGGEDEGWDVAVQSDGKGVVIGSTFSGANYDFGIARYNPDGTPDAAFGTNGKVTTDFSGDSDEAYDVIVQSDGKIIVVGVSFVGNPAEGDFALVRYNSNGTLDSTFGSGGKVTTDFAGDLDEAWSVELQPDQKIIVAGRRLDGNRDIAVARYNPDGSLDNSFSSDGKVTTDFVVNEDEAFDVAIQTDGKILVAGGSDSGFSYDFALVRYNSDGSLDTNFSFDGKVTTDFAGDFDEAIAIALQADGKIIAAGASSIGAISDFALTRYHADGTLDDTFGSDGKALTHFLGNDAALDVALQPDGKIVAVGYSISGAQSTGDFALARYMGDPPPPPPPTCLFCEDFDDGVLASNWTYSKPTWIENSGNLIGTPSSRKAETIATPAFSGCSVCSVTGTMSTAGGLRNKVWLLAWYFDKKNYVELLMREENDKWTLKQRSGGSVVAKAKGVSTILPNVFYNVEINFDGTNFTLVVDGVTLTTMPALASPNGTIGFRVKQTTGSISSVVVN